MKYLLLLTLILSCSSPKVQETEAKPTEAKAPSPYTVQSCYCMKIFQPVCADGQNFGNSCEAECKGHKTWTDGPCAKKK